MRSALARLDAMHPRVRRVLVLSVACELVGVLGFLVSMAALVLLASVARY